jgi:hypothetical protein
LWVSAGSASTLRTSTDAITWVTQVRSFGGSSIFSVAYGNELWVAVGGGGLLRTSTEALVYKSATNPSTFASSQLSILEGQ